MKSRLATNGFTLIEMMVAISIAAILLAIAVPSFSSSRLNSQLRASANDLVASINLARSEAIKRGASVTLCASADGEICSGTWAQGWIVLGGGEVLQRENAVPGEFRIIEAASTATLLFQSTGVDSTPATFTVCRSSSNSGESKRVITIDATGRASVSRTTSGSCS